MRDRLIEKIDTFCKKELGANFNKEIIENFADDLIADGWIRLPCKVGDVVYTLSKNKIYETKVFSMVGETEDGKWVYILKCNIFDGISMFKKFLFGKTVFLTREEAEKALRKDEGNADR